MEADQPASDTSSGADHLTGFVMPEIDEEGDDQDAPILVDNDGEKLDPKPAAPTLLTTDEFWQMYRDIWSAPQIIPKIGPHLAVLAVQPEEMDAARRASDGTYRLLERYFPKALLPGSDLLMDAYFAGSFLFAKVMLTRTILNYLRNPPQQKAAQPDTNAPPNHQSDSTNAPQNHQSDSVGNVKFLPPRPAE